MSRNIRLLPILTLFIWSCAQQGSPTGGPRDEDPPEVVESDPPNYSVRFDAKKIQVVFDEYVVLENVNQQLIVSPPMEEKPQVKLRKKTLIIEFEEELRPQTTYTFNFGTSIKDLHEGNVLENFEYVFSTGDILDSLAVKGTLKHARDLSLPEEPVSVMLYSDLRDSVPLTDIPLYVGRSNAKGVFSINNLQENEYKVFALKDGNNNFLFDLPTEEIAFLDSSLILSAEFAQKVWEEAAMDSIRSPGDTAGLEADSLPSLERDLNSVYIDLRLFAEEQELQYLLDYSRDDRRKLSLAFAEGLSDRFNYAFFHADGERELQVLEYFSKARDSLTIWVLDSTAYQQDSLYMRVSFQVRDSLDQYVLQQDTLLFSYREESQGRRSRSDQEDEEEEKLPLNSIRDGGQQDLHRDLIFESDFPIITIRDSLIRLFYIPDSVEQESAFVTFRDSSLLTRAWLSTDWEPDAQYHLQVFPGALEGPYDMIHDTLDIRFKTRDPEFYGQILLNLEEVENTVIIQLYAGSKLFRAVSVDAAGQYAFPYLNPREYQFQFIHDLNRNGKWDSGKYLEKKQPEKVEIMSGTVSVRSNWDHEVTMSLEN